MYPLKAYYIVFSLLIIYLMIWIFFALEKLIKLSGHNCAKLIKYLLALLRVVGDSTLLIYIFHWIVIDLTIWLFYPKIGLIWLTIPIFLIAFFVAKLPRLKRYAAEYLDK